MQVSEAKLIKVNSSSPHGPENRPYTFFSLSASEQMQYNTFRGERDNLERRMIQLREECGEIERSERNHQEKEIQELFLDLIKPHLEQLGLTVASSFAGYGEDKKTFVETPYYHPFTDNGHSDFSIRIVYWFSTKDNTLSCTTNLDYREGVSLGKSPKRQMVYDLLRRAIDGKKQDGINFPIVNFGGDFVYFASAEFAIPLIGAVRDILDGIGPEAVGDLNFLHSEYMKQLSYGEVSDTRIQQRVFREAYDRKLEFEMLKAGFTDQKLILVK